jgi:hypothetical protein
MNLREALHHVRRIVRAAEAGDVTARRWVARNPQWRGALRLLRLRRELRRIHDRQRHPSQQRILP